MRAASSDPVSRTKASDEPGCISQQSQQSQYNECQVAIYGDSEHQEQNTEDELKTGYLDVFKDPANCVGSVIVKLIVGLEEEIFQADKLLLCRESTFFDSAFNGRFLESCNEIRLPEESPLTINLLLSWVYGRKLSFFHGRRVLTAELSKGDILEYIALFNAADKMCMIALKKHVWGVILEWQRLNGFFDQHLLPAALALAITDELQKLFAIEIASIYRYWKGEDLPYWLAECLESFPSFASKVLIAQGTMTNRIVCQLKTGTQGKWWSTTS